MQVWKHVFDKAVEKINAIFPICVDHLDTCCSFCDEVHPFYVKSESNSLEEFDAVTKEIDEEIFAAKSQIKDVAMDRQHDELVNIFDNFERDNHHDKPDDPTDP